MVGSSVHVSGQIDIIQSSEMMVALRIAIPQHHVLDLKTRAIVQSSSFRDIISLERCWNAERPGKSRLALPSSVPNMHNLSLKEIILVVRGLKKLATRFPPYWKRWGDLLQNLPMLISLCRRRWLQKSKWRIM
jgi:hypothetical protein